MIKFHSICLSIVVFIITKFIIYVIKNNCPKDMLFWLILIASILIIVQQLLYIIEYSIGG